jgi:hypothetical protein
MHDKHDCVVVVQKTSHGRKSTASALPSLRTPNLQSRYVELVEKVRHVNYSKHRVSPPDIRVKCQISQHNLHQAPKSRTIQRRFCDPPERKRRTPSGTSCRACFVTRPRCPRTRVTNPDPVEMASTCAVGLHVDLYSACMAPTGSYGCEVWAFLPASGDAAGMRSQPPTSHLHNAETQLLVFVRQPASELFLKNWVCGR